MDNIIYTYIYIYIYKVKVKLMTVVKVDPKAPFSLVLHQGEGKGATPLTGLLNITLDL